MPDHARPRNGPLMRITWPMLAGNAVAVQTALIVASYLYYRHRTRPAGARGS